MSYNGKNRKIKADGTRKKIYESAKILFSQNDYNAVSVDSIVEMAGVAKGCFYIHFASKDALITSIINDYVMEADADYKYFLNSFTDDTPAEIIVLSLIGKISDLLIEKIGCDKMKIVYKAQITKDINTTAITGYNRELYKLFSEVLERGIQRQEFKTELPLDILVKHFIMAIRGITYEWCIRYPEFDYKMQALQHFKILLAGIKDYK